MIQILRKVAVNMNLPPSEPSEFAKEILKNISPPHLYEELLKIFMAIETLTNEEFRVLLRMYVTLNEET